MKCYKTSAKIGIVLMIIKMISYERVLGFFAFRFKKMYCSNHWEKRHYKDRTLDIANTYIIDY